MKTCKYCGKEISDELEVCPFCNAVQDDQKDKNDERAYSQMARFLKYEHIAWKAGGFVALGGCALYVCIALTFLAIGILGAASGGIRYFGSDYHIPEYYGDRILPFFVFMFFGAVYLITFLVAFLPIIIANFKMVKRVEFYQGCMETDIAVTRTRCKSVGMIVFAAIFNKAALVFIIINFVKTRTHAAEFDRIEARQKEAHAETQGEA